MFGVGSVPKALLPTLKKEGIVVMDEGMPGQFITRRVNGPQKRFRARVEGFSGSLVVTTKRVVCHTYGKRQINISTEDPKISELHIDAPDPKTLSIFFESSVFRKGWSGKIEFRFKTEKTPLFCDSLLSIGARQGTAPNAHSATRQEHDL